jgi:cytosine/uracil/thiamine/allantoin permease
MSTVLQTTVAVQLAAIDAKAAVATKLENRRIDERGEGVISAAIAVMIMAVIGVALYVAFDKLVGETSKKATDSVNSITAKP